MTQPRTIAADDPMSLDLRPTTVTVDAGAPVDDARKAAAERRTWAVEALMRRADAAFDAAATIVALAVLGRASAVTAGLILSVHVLLSLSRNQPLPFRLNQYLPIERNYGSMLVAVLAVGLTDTWAPAALLQVAAATLALCVAFRTVFVGTVRWARRRGLLRERALIVGNSLERLALRSLCRQQTEYGIDVIGEIHSSELHETIITAATSSRPRESEPTALLLARGVTLTPDLLGELRWAVTRGYRVLIETARTDDELPASEVVPFGSARVICLPLAPLSYRSWLIKRAFDLTVSSALLALLAPVLVAVAIGVKVTSPGPVIFRQGRVGRDGRPFTMLKFRTFPVDHVDDQFSLDHGACPLPFGRFLRRTSLDELPQLVNVLRGDMSIVGPRPERLHFVEDLTDEVPGYHERHRVPGGITGLAQVSGCWGNSSIRERVDHDNAYIDNWRLRRDFAILARTLPAAIRKGRG